MLIFTTIHGIISIIVEVIGEICDVILHIGSVQ